MLVELEQRCSSHMVARMEPAQAMMALDYTALGTDEAVKERALQLCARFTSEVISSQAFLDACPAAMRSFFTLDPIAEAVSEVELFNAVKDLKKN